MLDVIARAEHLMRTRHAALYPAEFAREWARRYREEVVALSLDAFRGALDRLLAAREDALPLGDAAIVGALRERALTGLAARWTDYSGDLSCYS